MKKRAYFRLVFLAQVLLVAGLGLAALANVAAAIAGLQAADFDQAHAPASIGEPK